MTWLQSIVDFLNTYVIEIGISIGGENIPFMVILLLGTGFYLTVRTGFIQLRRLGPRVRGDHGEVRRSRRPR